MLQGDEWYLVYVCSETFFLKAQRQNEFYIMRKSNLPWAKNNLPSKRLSSLEYNSFIMVLKIEEQAFLFLLLSTLLQTMDQADGTVRSISAAPPSHYIVNIKNYSSFAEEGVERYESGVFEAGGYKWKLVLYPNGNKSKNVTRHLSLYLAMADTSSPQLDWEVHAFFRFFLHDQREGNYVIFQDSSGKEKHFRWRNLEWGFDRLIPLTALDDAVNGYLVEDTFVFGAEVFVRQEKSRGKGECLSMIKEAPSSRYDWSIGTFSGLDAYRKESNIFTAGDQKWKLVLYPKGTDPGRDTHVSLYLALADSTTLSPGSKILADFTLRMVDHGPWRRINWSAKANHWFSASNLESGWSKFVSRVDVLHFPNDSYSVDANVTILAIANAFI